MVAPGGASCGKTSSRGGRTTKCQSETDAGRPDQADRRRHVSGAARRGDADRCKCRVTKDTLSGPTSHLLTHATPFTHIEWYDVKTVDHPEYYESTLKRGAEPQEALTAANMLVARAVPGNPLRHDTVEHLCGAGARRVTPRTPRPPHVRALRPGPRQGLRGRLGAGAGVRRQRRWPRRRDRAPGSRLPMPWAYQHQEMIRAADPEQEEAAVDGGWTAYGMFMGHQSDMYTRLHLKANCLFGTARSLAHRVMQLDGRRRQTACPSCALTSRHTCTASSASRNGGPLGRRTSRASILACASPRPPSRGSSCCQR